jgi:hypothetical protein
MKECSDFESLIDRAQMGQASDQEMETLLDHLESCSDCSDAFEALGRLRNDDSYPEPASGELLSMRNEVVRKIRQGQSRENIGSFSVASFLMRPAFISVFALGILVLGFFLGVRLVRSPAKNGEAQSSAGPDRCTNAIKKVAQSHAVYEDIVNSPFTYTNVRVAEEKAGTVHLSFDVSRHMDLSLKRDDPLLAEVLVQSLLEPSGVDARLAAISISQNVPDSKIKKSLIFAMLHDENLAVRMTAQTKLIERRGDPEITDSLLAVLEREPSVRMRLVAIDYLASCRIQPKLLEQAVAAGKREGSDAVLVRASQYLNR